MEKFNLITNSLVDLGDNLEAETNGKGRKFVSRFIEAGVAHYEQFGDVLITKETLDKFIHTMVGCPVIIKHKDITDKNADKERVGVVSDVWYNEQDGYFYCSGIIWDKQAIDLVKNQGWNVSCTYDFESDKQEKTHNGKKIDMEFTDGEFLHLALVDNPRYERANIVMNSKVENEEHWITVGSEDGKKGTHILVKDGETNKEATERKIAEWEGKENKKEEKSTKRGDLGEDSPRHIYGKKKEGSIPVALKTTYYPNWNKEEIVKEFGSEEEALDYAEERGEAVKKDYINKTKTAEKYGLATWVTPKELEHIKKHGYYPDEEDSDLSKEIKQPKEDKLDIKKTTVKMKSGKEKETLNALGPYGFSERSGNNVRHHYGMDRISAVGAVVVKIFFR